MPRLFDNLFIKKLASFDLYLYWYIVFNLEALRPLMASIMIDWMTSTSDWERNTMLNLARRGRSLSFRCCMAAMGTIIFYISFHMLRFFKNIHQPRRNLVYRLGDIQKSPTYEITYFIQLSGGTYTVLSNYTIDCFVSILVLHVCAQLINLRTTLNNLVNELASESITSSRFKEGLAAIAERHEHLIRYAGECFGALFHIMKYL